MPPLRLILTLAWALAACTAPGEPERGPLSVTGPASEPLPGADPNGTDGSLEGGPAAVASADAGPVGLHFRPTAHPSLCLSSQPAGAGVDPVGRALPCATAANQQWLLQGTQLRQPEADLCLRRVAASGPAQLAAVACDSGGSTPDGWSLSDDLLTYQVAGGGPALCLALGAGEGAGGPGLPLALSACNGADASQTWSAAAPVYLGFGTKPALCLGQGKTAAALAAAPCATAPGQQWQLIGRTLHLGARCLTADGPNLTLSACADPAAAGQGWAFNRGRLQQRGSSVCVSLVGPVTASGAAVGTSACAANPERQGVSLMGL